MAPFPPKRDAYAVVVDEPVEVAAEGEAEEVEDDLPPLWDAVETWIENIEKNENKKVIFELEKGKYVPPRFIITVLKELYPNDDTRLKIAKEKVITPTIDQYRGEFEGVKQQAKTDVQNNLGNLISGMGLKTPKQTGKPNGRTKSESVSKPKQQSKPSSSSNKKIMNHLRGCGLVPL